MLEDSLIMTWKHESSEKQEMSEMYNIHTTLQHIYVGPRTTISHGSFTNSFHF